MRNELTKLEEENKKLVAKLENANKEKKPPSPSSSYKRSKDFDSISDGELKKHMNELNQTICKLNHLL